MFTRSYLAAFVIPVAILLILAGCDGLADPYGANGFQALQNEQAPAGRVDERYLVAAGPGAIARIERAGYSVLHSLADDAVLIVRGSPGRQGEIASLGGVQHVVQDFEISLDEFDTLGFSTAATAAAEPDPSGTPALWHLQWEKRLMSIPEAHQIATGAGTTIAIVDTGIQPGHPDLGNLNLDKSVAFINGKRIEAGEPTDLFGHGTMVAGIAAAQGHGVLGTAPDAELVSIRVFSADGVTTGADILLALEYAAEIGSDAANLSLATAPIPARGNAGGIRAISERLANHVMSQGTIITAAAGNSNANLQHEGWFVLDSSMAGTVGASATGPDDLLTFYSNYGTNVIDVAAPGGGMADPVDSYCGSKEYFLEGRIAEPGEETEVCFFDPDAVFPIPTYNPDFISVCVPCTTPELPFPLNGIISTAINPVTGEHGYAFDGGTSFAAPHVAGLVALVRELEPDMNPRRVMDAIAQGAEGAPGRSDPDLGAGRVNALNTVLRRAGK